MKHVVWLPSAAADREELYEYIHAQDPQTAARIRDRLHEAAASLSRFPDRGALGAHGTRRLIVGPFILRYRVEADLVFHDVPPCPTSRRIDR